jgi:hypothetical protein
MSLDECFGRGFNSRHLHLNGLAYALGRFILGVIVVYWVCLSPLEHGLEQVGVLQSFEP